MRAVTTAILVLAVGLFVQACVFPVWACFGEQSVHTFWSDDGPVSSEEQSTRDDVVALLGEPYATTEAQGHSIDVYDYDVFCAAVEPVFFSRFLTGEINLGCWLLNTKTT